MDYYESLLIERTKNTAVCDMADTHVHAPYELYFLLSGERRYLIGHKIYHVSAGDLIIIPPNVIHRTTMLNNRGYDRYVLYFSEEAIEELQRQIEQSCLSGILHSGCLQFSASHSAQMRRLFEQFETEHQKNDLCTKPMKLTILYQILLLALRHGSPKPCAQDQSSDRIQKTAQYISENYASDITLHDAANIAFMEDTYFSKCFKKLTGFGFHEYLTQARIRAAEELLTNSDLSISEISEQCGFSSSNYFGDLYKKRTGSSPSEYRQRHS